MQDIEQASIEEFPSVPACDPCNDPLYRACANVTPVEANLAMMVQPVAHKKGERIAITDRYCHPHNYYSHARNAVCPRYSVCDWDASAKMQCDTAHRESKFAQKVDASSWQVVKGLEGRMTNRQCSNTKKLAARSFEVSFWKEQLITEVDAMNAALTNLIEQRRVLAKYLADIQIPLEISEECLLQRDKRVGIDQCHDEVEKCLSKEVLMIRRVQSMLRKYIDKAIAQLRQDRCAQTACDVDVADKNHSQALDDRLHQLRNTTCGLTFHPGIELVDNTLVDKKTWVKYTRENLVRSELERERSDKLRVAMDTYMRSAAVDLNAIFNQVNHVLNARVRETTDLKGKLQDHLNQIVNDIRDMERKIAVIKKAIEEKYNAIKVAQTRLDERTRRLNLELCYDEPKKGLICEVQELYSTIRQLKVQLHECEMTLTRLVKVRHQLLADIAIKENTLLIDQRCCIGRRRSMAMDPNCGVALTMNPCSNPCS